MKKNKGRYLGTSIGQNWWKRFAEKGDIPRCRGEYWYDKDQLYFQRYLTQEPLSIPFDKVHDLQIGKWHCGTWAWGMPVVKFLWKRDQIVLCSGFVLAWDRSKTRQNIHEIGQETAVPLPDWQE